MSNWIHAFIKETVDRNTQSVRYDKDACVFYTLDFPAFTVLRVYWFTIYWIVGIKLKVACVWPAQRISYHVQTEAVL